MTDWMTLDEVEERIHSIYMWWSITAPGVYPKEEGELAALWAIFDRAVAEGKA